MVVSVAINYIDRGSFSTAAPLLQIDMAIPPAQLGLLLSSFFWSYALLQIRERGFSMDRMAIVTAVAYCVTAMSTTTTGRLADRFIAAGSSPTRVRKFCTAIGLAFATAVVGVAFVQSLAGAMAILMFSCLSYGVFASHWAITQTIAGPLAVGKWSGLQNCIANMAGVAAPAVTGIVLKNTGHFFWAFALASGVVLTGAAV